MKRTRASHHVLVQHAWLGDLDNAVVALQSGGWEGLAVSLRRWYLRLSLIVWPNAAGLLRSMLP